jgi:hypothetical protein
VSAYMVAVAVISLIAVICIRETRRVPR